VPHGLLPGWAYDRLLAVLWRTGRYAMSKRQLNAREIARLELRSPKLL
jgi:hypothetical protein